MTKFGRIIGKFAFSVHYYRWVPLWILLLLYLGVNSIYWFVVNPGGIISLNLVSGGMCVFAAYIMYRGITKEFKGLGGYITYAWGTHISVEFDDLTKMFGMKYDMDVHHGYREYIDSNISIWATENNIKHWLTKWDYDATMIFVFRKKVDAMAFKLEWI